MRFWCEGAGRIGIKEQTLFNVSKESHGKKVPCRRITKQCGLKLMKMSLYWAAVWRARLGLSLPEECSPSAEISRYFRELKPNELELNTSQRDSNVFISTFRRWLMSHREDTFKSLALALEIQYCTYSDWRLYIACALEITLFICTWKLFSIHKTQWGCFKPIHRCLKFYI